MSIARIASCATVGTELVLTRLANCINYVDRRLCGRRLSIVFVKVKGTVGIGTVLFAFGIGPIVQAALAVFDREHRVGRQRRPELAEELASPGTVGE